MDTDVITISCVRKVKRILCLFVSYLSDVVVYGSNVAVMPASLLGGGGASSVGVAI